MGLGRKLRDAAAAALKAAEAPPSEEQLAKLTPEQRERYELHTARAEQIRSGALAPPPITGLTAKLMGAKDAAAAGLESRPVAEDARLVGEALRGPAGDVVHKVVKAPKGPDRIEDAAEWERVMRAERATRDAAREPYLTPGRAPIRISRVAAQGGTQAEEVADYLASTGLAGRPDLVFGLYRVPDRIGPTGGTEKRRVVEWDVVHASTAQLAPAAPPADVFFDAGKPWVARRPGEPSVLDEDLALAYLVSAGIGPEQTLGVARHCTIDPYSDQDGDGHMTARVQGVHAFHSAGVGGTVAREMAEAAPLTLEPRPPDGIWLELLNWDAVARAVHPVRQQRPRIPSQFPYLPLTAQELLRSYLEVVGIAPQDSYGVQATYDRPVDLLGRTSTSTWVSVRRTTGGDKMPCADGEDRVRLHGGDHVVVAYRDSDAYAEGRQRWAGYQADVLQADLARRVYPRGPVPKPDSRLERALDRVNDVVAFFDPDESTEDGFVPPRYCWPPA